MFTETAVLVAVAVPAAFLAGAYVGDRFLPVTALKAKFDEVRDIVRDRAEKVRDAARGE
jgi:hypothetical protein